MSKNESESICPWCLQPIDAPDSTQERGEPLTGKPRELHTDCAVEYDAASGHD
jgi:hypothetical protein